MTNSTNSIREKSPALVALLNGVTEFDPNDSYPEEFYPFALQEQYERVFETIVTLWQANHSGELLSYFDGLLIDKRGERQGFPVEVGKDIFFLSSMYEKYMRQRNHKAATVMERARREIENELHRELNSIEFYKAIELREVKVVALYLTAGMDIEVEGHGGMTPLLWATFNGAADVAECLLENGASTNACDRNGNSLLHWAAFNGLTDICRKLLEKLSTDVKARNGWTPLFHAVARGHYDVAKLLLDRGANVNCVDAGNTSPLLKAISNKQFAIVGLLIERGANPLLKDNNGMTPLNLAREKGQSEIFRQLNAVLDSHKSEGYASGT